MAVPAVAAHMRAHVIVYYYYIFSDTWFGQINVCCTQPVQSSPLILRQPLCTVQSSPFILLFTFVFSFLFIFIELDFSWLVLNFPRLSSIVFVLLHSSLFLFVRFSSTLFAFAQIHSSSIFIVCLSLSLFISVCLWFQFGSSLFIHRQTSLFVIVHLCSCSSSSLLIFIRFCSSSLVACAFEALELSSSAKSV